LKTALSSPELGEHLEPAFRLLTHAHHERVPLVALERHQVEPVAVVVRLFDPVEVRELTLLEIARVEVIPIDERPD